MSREAEVRITSELYSAAAEMAANAKDGTLKLSEGVYRFVFSRERWLYDVYAPSGAYLTNFNTKSLKQARQWLREYMAS